MRNMRDRVELKKETDIEKKIKEEKRRAKKRAEEKDDRKSVKGKRDFKNKVNK